MKRQSFLIAGAGAMLAGCAASAVPTGSPVAPRSQPAARAKTKRGDEGWQLLGSLLLVPYDFVPREFAACDGSIREVKKELALFSLLWTKFGGDGKTSFGLPDLRGKAPIEGLSYVIAIDGVFPTRKFRGEANGIPPLLGQLLLVPYLPAFIPPPGFAACDGKVLEIRENQALYSVLGTKFGGNGRTNFALPDLREHRPGKNLTYLIATQGRYPSAA